jgi:hypothetical protein
MINKFRGCNHVDCRACGASFCFECLTSYTKKGKQACKCDAWNDADELIDEQERRVDNARRFNENLNFEQAE